MLFNSLYDFKEAEIPAPADIALRDELLLFSAAAALVRVSPAFFTRHPIEAQVVLASLPDASDLLRRLLDRGHSVVAGRLAGALRRIGRSDMADEIAATMKTAGYDVRQSDPFVPEQSFHSLGRGTAPIAGRIQAMWEAMRGPVLDAFPKPPGLPHDRDAYLKFVNEIYKSDAYHWAIESLRSSSSACEARLDKQAEIGYKMRTRLRRVMPVTVELTPEIEASYAAEAAAQGLPLSELLRHVLEERAAARRAKNTHA